MSTPETPLDGPLSQWFWVATLQHGPNVGTATGCATVPDSDTRRDVYEGVMAEARRRLRIPVGEFAAVLFYSAEPMALADGRRS